VPLRTWHSDLVRIVAPFQVASLLLTTAGRPFPAVQQPLIVACRPDTSVAELGQRVTLRAFTTPIDTAAAPARYLWSTSAGVIIGKGPTAEWQVPAEQPGAYTATVDVRHSSSSETCSIRVVVLRADATRSAETRRLFLTPDHKKEAKGFRRYSYLLFGTLPSDEMTRQRYLAALTAYTSIPTVPDVFLRDLNVTWLPLTELPRTEDQYAAEWLLKHYDWERARDFLTRLPGDHLDGPYIVTYGEPLSDVDVLEKDYLYQDLSSVPPELVAAWVREFMLQAAQEHFWNVRTKPMLALRLRTVIEVLAGALPNPKSLATSIAWR
jgi:hypothetical protein